MDPVCSLNPTTKSNTCPDFTSISHLLDTSCCSHHRHQNRHASDVRPNLTGSDRTGSALALAVSPDLRPVKTFQQGKHGTDDISLD